MPNVDLSTLTMYNLDGKLLLQNTFKGHHVINTDNIDSGTYILKITDSQMNILRTERITISK